MYKLFFKRLMDICVSLISLVILFPVLIVLALMIRMKLGSPILFSQQRPGKNEKIFTLYKFRTMTSVKDEAGNLLPDSVRLTSFGKFLRASSLDELPELYNILIGDMSLVGPRPLLVQYLELYSDEQKKRHNVRPGLTGLAQINGRNTLNWQDKFKYDVSYVEDITFIKDMKILLGTIKKVLNRDGITSNTSATMEAFKGNER